MREAVERNATRLATITPRDVEMALAEFDIAASVASVSNTDAIGVFEATLARGTRLSKVIRTADDLALSLSAMGVRITPVLERGCVAIEVSQQRPSPFSIGSGLSLAGQAEEMDLPIIFGKSPAQELIIRDLAKMPHLLVAGSTGSGKSNFLHAVVLSLINDRGPDRLALSILDAKQTEFGAYATLPHLFHQIATTPEDISASIRAAVAEMESRYRSLAAMGARGIDEIPGSMARLVIIVDEFADLGGQLGGEFLYAVQRIAQKGRAAGVHLIAATQRTSADVVSGVIKANFPARLAFRLPARVDSRTIIDRAGAERLLGCGDGLLVEFGGAPQRLQAPEATAHDVVAFVARHTAVGARPIPQCRDRDAEQRAPHEVRELLEKLNRAFGDRDDVDWSGTPTALANLLGEHAQKLGVMIAKHREHLRTTGWTIRTRHSGVRIVTVQRAAQMGAA